VDVKKKLLLVEDDTVQIQILSAKLSSSGFDVSVARDAAQAISLARQTRPNVILLDIGLPGGGGYIVLERLKALMILIPVLALSSRPAATERDKMIASGAADYFEKGVDLGVLVKRIEELAAT